MKKFPTICSRKVIQSKAVSIVALICATITGCSPVDDVAPKKVNLTHRFELNSCDIRYNGKPLELGASVDDWQRELGPYDRKVPLANDLYVWDDIGITLYVEPNKTEVKQLAIIFNQEKAEIPAERMVELYDEELASGRFEPGSKDYELIASMKETKILIIDSRPQSPFKDGFLMDGVVIDEQVDVRAINKARYQLDQSLPRFEKRYLPTIYNLEYDCPDGRRVSHQINLLTSDRSKMRKYEVHAQFLKTGNPP